MAYLRGYAPPKCKHPGCHRRVTCELIDRWNGSRGFYCKPHGERAKAEQERNEAG